MMNISDINQTIKTIAINLVEANYKKICEDDYKTALNLENIKAAVEDYPGTMTVPSEIAYDSIFVQKITDDVYHVDFDLW